MKKCLFVGFMMFLLPVIAFAEESTKEAVQVPAEKSNWYLSTGVGEVTFKDVIKPTRIMLEIMNTPGVSTTWSGDNKSTFESIYLGYNVNKYLALEGGVAWNLRASDSFTVHNVNIGALAIEGVPVDFTTLPANLTVQREGRGSYIGLMAVGKLPITEYLGLFAKGGGIKYKVDSVTKMHLYKDIYLAEERTFIDETPILTAGVEVKPWKNFSITAEFTSTKKVDMTSLSAHIYF